MSTSKTFRQAVSFSSQLSGIFLACCFLVCFVGCGNGPKLAKVMGTVTYKGKPVSGLVVNFIPENGKRKSGGSTDSEGKFQLIYDPNNAGAIVGKHEASIDVEDDIAMSLLGSTDSANITKDVEVVSGENNFDFKLEEFKPPSK